jgi:riboflavin kinase
MHDFEADFYGLELKAIVLGYIRPELDYTSRGTQSIRSGAQLSLMSFTTEALIDDIDTDKRVALNCLKRPAYKSFECDSHFTRTMH